MAMTVIDSEGIADGALPVAELAAQMRLADGFDVVPGLAARLRLRLRAAIGTVERRLGKAVIGREFTLAGPAQGGRRVVLPIAPVTGVVGVSVTRDGVPVLLGQAVVEEDCDHPVIVLPQSVGQGEWLRLTVQAGYGPWEAVPVDLRQAVLLTAEALDAGEGYGLGEAAQALLAPFRSVRIGRAGR